MHLFLKITQPRFQRKIVLLSDYHCSHCKKASATVKKMATTSARIVTQIFIKDHSLDFFK